ncbi:MAG: hypothetical protein ACC652_05160 [Acidimicrobiales bacterium]
MSALGDDELVELLAEALRRSDPVPEKVLEGAKAAFTWISIDRELLEITSDTSFVGAGMRGVGDEGRFVVMEADGLTIEIEIGTPPAARVVGQIVPPKPAVVSAVRASGEKAVVETDDLGRFVFPSVDAGSVCFSIELEPGQTFDSEWITV